MDTDRPTTSTNAAIIPSHQFYESMPPDQWIFQQIRPAMKQKVLDTGSGDGNLASFFVQDGFALRISDPDSHHCQLLQKRFEGEPMIKGVHQLDLADRDFEKTYAKFLGIFDTVISINTRERNANESLIVNNAKKLLKERGRLILLLPVRTALYEESEEGFQEWYRANRRNIRNLSGKENEILSTQYFNVWESPQSLAPNAYYQQVPLFLATSGDSLCPTGLWMLVVLRILNTIIYEH